MCKGNFVPLICTLVFSDYNQNRQGEAAVACPPPPFSCLQTSLHCKNHIIYITYNKAYSGFHKVVCRLGLPSQSWHPVRDCREWRPTRMVLFQNCNTTFSMKPKWHHRHATGLTKTLQFVPKVMLWCWKDTKPHLLTTTMSSGSEKLTGGLLLQ